MMMMMMIHFDCIASPVSQQRHDRRMFFPVCCLLYADGRPFQFYILQQHPQ